MNKAWECSTARSECKHFGRLSVFRFSPASFALFFCSSISAFVIAFSKLITFISFVDLFHLLIPYRFPWLSGKRRLSQSSTNLRLVDWIRDKQTDHAVIVFYWLTITVYFVWSVPCCHGVLCDVMYQLPSKCDSHWTISICSIVAPRQRGVSWSFSVAEFHLTKRARSLETLCISSYGAIFCNCYIVTEP